MCARPSAFTFAALRNQQMTDNAGCRFNSHVTGATGRPEAEVNGSPEVVSCSRLHAKLVSVDAHLQAKALWNEFHTLGTEMIVTKAGRCAYSWQSLFSITYIY